MWYLCVCVCLKTCFPWKPCFFDTEDYEKPLDFWVPCVHTRPKWAVSNQILPVHTAGMTGEVCCHLCFWISGWNSPNKKIQKIQKKENPSNIRYPVWARNFQKSRWKPGVLGMFNVNGEGLNGLWQTWMVSACFWDRHQLYGSPIGPGVRLLNSMASMEVSADSISYNAAMAACSSLWQQAHPADDEKSWKVLIHVDTLWFIGGKSIVTGLITNL